MPNSNDIRHGPKPGSHEAEAEAEAEARLFVLHLSAKEKHHDRVHFF